MRLKEVRKIADIPLEIGQQLRKIIVALGIGRHIRRQGEQALLHAVVAPEPVEEAASHLPVGNYRAGAANPGNVEGLGGRVAQNRVLLVRRRSHGGGVMPPAKERQAMIFSSSLL